MRLTTFITVSEGQFFGLFGPNGAGKTMFINILVGLANRTGGEARAFVADRIAASFTA